MQEVRTQTRSSLGPAQRQGSIRSLERVEDFPLLPPKPNGTFEKLKMALGAFLLGKLEFECEGTRYELTGLKLRKVLNWLAIEFLAFRRSEKLWAMPTHIQIEPTTRCNLKCPICPVTTGLGRKDEDLDIGVFRRLIDEIGDYLFFLTFWNWGEPFLHQDAAEMIRYATQKGIRVVTSTNGHTLTRPGLADRIVWSGLDTLIVAIDGVEQESYVQYRTGGNLERVKKGIKAVAEAKQRAGSRYPLINIRFLAMRQNEHELPRMKRMAFGLGADALSVKTLNPYSGSSEDPNNDFLPLDPALRRFTSGEDGRTRIRRSRNPCKSLWINPVVHSDGEICTCCFDFSGRHNLGNLKHQSFKKIWNSPGYRSLRREFREDWQQIPLCKDCTYAFEGGSAGVETTAGVIFFKNL